MSISYYEAYFELLTSDYLGDWQQALKDMEERFGHLESGKEFVDKTYEEFYDHDKARC